MFCGTIYTKHTLSEVISLQQTQKFILRNFRLLLLILVMLTIITLLYTGTIWPNDWFVSQHSVLGLDVSNHQKHIDWKRVAQTGKYSFVFIKATEGTGYQDAYFQANWQGAKAQGLLRGAYHFYTANLSGDEQANNYINTVPKEAGMLPPVLDLEVSSTDHEKMLHEITVFLGRLERHYNARPIIYTDLTRYAEYIQGHFDDYAIWIGEAFFPIQWSPVTAWTFWQYNDRGHIPGISQPVDLNVFYGDKDRLTALTH